MSTTTSTGPTYTVTQDGQTVITSSSPWYQAVRAMVALAVERKIDLGSLVDWCESWTQAIHDDGDMPARRLHGLVLLRNDEPPCACDPYENPPCGHWYPGAHGERTLDELREAIGI